MKKYRFYLFTFFLLTILFLQLIFSIPQKSPTFDEPVHLAAGYSYLKTGDYRMNVEHPPLMKLLAGIPVLFLNASIPLDHYSWRETREWLFGDEFFYHNRIDADKLLCYGRIATAFISILLGFFLYQWAERLYGPNAAILALFLYIFCPNIIANSQLITTDIVASCFIFLSVYTFWCYLNEPVKKNLVFAGASLGLALASKFTTIILFPIYFFLFIFYAKKNKPKKYFQYFLSFIWIGFIALFVLALTYRFTETGRYFLGLKRIFLEATERGHVSFLLGKYSNTGWRYYYLIAFLLKTPLALLCFLFLHLFWKTKEKKFNQLDYFLLIPAILIFLNASFSRKQLGIRYALPVYPFLFVWVSGIVTSLNKKAYRKLILLVACVWYLFSSVKIYPHHLAYFNELAGGPDNGWKYLADSNIDWGQDLKGLKKYMQKNGVNEIVLSYSGIANPHYYGIEYQDLVASMMYPRRSRINSLTPNKEILAMSVNNLQCIYFYDRHLFDWLKKIKPIAKIGYSIFVYEITTDIYVHEYLAQIYYNSGWWEEALRECNRLLILQPDNPVALLTLACFYADKDKIADAIEYYDRLLTKRADFLPKRLSLMNYGSYVLHSCREVNPESYYRSLFGLASIYFAQVRYDRALSVYQKIVQLYPDSVEAYNNLGVVYEKLRKDNEAIDAYRQAINLNQNFVDAYFNLGVVYWKRNQWQEVIEQLGKVLELNPKHSEAQKYFFLAQEKLRKQ